MRSTLRRTTASLVAVGVAGLALCSLAAAHGTISPAVAAGGVAQRFELTVPNSRLDADIVGVSLEFPSGATLESAEATQPRWAVTSSEDSVRWTGGPIDRGSAETFAFSARLSSTPGPAEFVLVERYDDGDAAPFPITVVASTTGPAAAVGGVEDTLALVALLVAALAVVAASVALAFALRLREQLEKLDTPKSGV